MIRATALTKSYLPGAPVLAGLDLHVEKGACVILRGASGAGKTTLLRLIRGELDVDGGGIEVGGQPVSSARAARDAAWRRKIAIAHQRPRLIDSLTVEENIALPLLVRGRGHGVRARVARLLEMMSLGEAGARSPAALSAGELARVALARACVDDPDVLLVDEPTAHLDDQLAERLLHVVERAVLRGTTVLIATHDPRVRRAEAWKELRLARGVLAAEPTLPGTLSNPDRASLPPRSLHG